MTNRKKILIFLLIIFVISLKLIIPRLILLYKLNHNFSRSKYPQAYTLLEYRSINYEFKDDEMVEKIKCYNLNFVIRGKEVDRIVGSSAIGIYIDKDNKIIVSEGDDYKLLENIFDNLSKSELNKIYKLFGEESFSSNYYFYENIINVSPDQINFFTPKNEMVAKIALLPIKLMTFVLLPGDKEEIYNFELEQVKGFQLGTPHKSHYVTIMLYDEEGYEYMITFMGDDFTQDDIDAVLSTLTIE